jgi:branched-subunit amino acid aminotransferase/4-amino-4-deoxychorismate lyase
MFCRLPISQEEFNNADEVFITSSSGGVTATQKSGPVTQQLMTEYENMKDIYATDLN